MLCVIPSNYRVKQSIIANKHEQHDAQYPAPLFVSFALCPLSSHYLEISFAETKRIYMAGSGLFIDARGIKFYKQGTILGAINMPIMRFGRIKRLLPGKKVAEEALGELEAKWGEKCPMVIDSWINHWEELSHYFRYTEPIRRIIYATNTIEGFHRQIRKITKPKGGFTNDNSLFKKPRVKS